MFSYADLNSQRNAVTAKGGRRKLEVIRSLGRRPNKYEN